MVNYKKLDPGLIQACHELVDSEEKKFNVFIQFNRRLNDDELILLEDKGIHITDSTKKIITAILSKNEVESFSEKQWIKQLTLSSKLKLLD